MQIARVQIADGSIHFAAERGTQLLRIEGSLFDDFKVTDERLIPVRRLCPIQPSAIFGIGLNYRAHAEEMNADLPEHPVVFMKNPAAAHDPDSAIQIPRHLHSDQVDYEAELAVIIGKTCKNVPPARALEHVFGYTCANDVSARDWQKFHGGGQWSRGKSFDTFCPLGPVIVTADDIPNPQILPIRGILNGEIRQESWTGDMIFSVAEIISFLSGSTTLLPGTVILTGTPPGVGMAAEPQRFLKQGDDICIEITGIGMLRNPVSEEVTG
ncbi:fumarylacetoacetate hydrolase family protein [Coraliomargarita akajimensis]|uniref:5-carboxymethyl-2-hydroxymuconateDelta-isomerase n=1 Tax=Coraliomargarita akajimensis (strain DSM 45221 / IAM 15411 / JCM 23193 / KCTC 12865 / 04OKA010-24) TaxID=583355 RepID=D5EJ76_CORAD|nr:fumarylacetoacetate hydrolase family protein [Coraliomargarita akajimensis]ADE54475.1 5-carboxymethyl-2-hydroxymuconateDelta-isomerase [Coraliomargarita akajimensis DSM 45221]